MFDLDDIESLCDSVGDILVACAKIVLCICGIVIAVTATIGLIYIILH